MALRRWPAFPATASFSVSVTKSTLIKRNPIRMKRSFDNVDHKVAEAEYFLLLIASKNGVIPEINFLLSAYASAARSITLALHAVLGDAPGFSEWYARHQAALKADQVARYFVELRNFSQKTGATVVNCASFGPELRQMLRRRLAGYRGHWFGSSGEDMPPAPDMDVAEGCKQNFVRLLEIVYTCYCDFGPLIDPQQHYTPEHYATIGKTIEDAEEELGYPRGWTASGEFADPRYIPHRFELLRHHAAGACGINHIFEKYLNRVTPIPAPLPPIDLPEDEGWTKTNSGDRVWIPREFTKIGTTEGDFRLYLESLRISRQRKLGEASSSNRADSESSDFRWLRELVFSATSQIRADYLNVPVAGAAESVIRERLFCYEFYHQLRLAATAFGFPYSIGGELDKRGHPIIRGDFIPDFVIHQPGDMSRNLCVIEVKPISGLRDGFVKDIRTLTTFVRDYGYHRGVLLVFGEGRRGHGLLARRTGSIQALRAAGVRVWWLKRTGEAPSELQ